ncbi:hypothetical protein COV16_05140 [Candidatus Woesearchaeota archaeon CG10_big_fil_rev_8_21_14_0_10_34_8]|nr:MAG: hypothetical protein COV16_05140 [Candidatus Woesearchaeota archaeon CG10_big_fil_rev_8_21_14_0_10_34_8]
MAEDVDVPANQLFRSIDDRVISACMANPTHRKEAWDQVVQRSRGYCGLYADNAVRSCYECPYSQGRAVVAVEGPNNMVKVYRPCNNYTTAK